MNTAIERPSVSRCALDASCSEAFTQRGFVDLINEAHAQGQDYYIARAHLKKAPGGLAVYYCYDARQLCKYIYEMVISAEGRRIRIKNFKDPVTLKDLSEINFFRLRYDSDTPLRAEFVGNHVSFLESNAMRNKIFLQEDASDALSINFQFKSSDKQAYIKQKGLMDFVLVIILLILLGTVAVIGIKYGKNQIFTRDITTRHMNKKLI